MSDNNLVKLTSYSAPYMAEILKGALEANGISAHVFNTHSSSIMPHLSQIIPFDVMVQKKDLVAAKKLMLEFESSALSEEPPEE
ncbi:MAG: DUF2007 domain-containing protein [Bdellovibrionota bacterium]